MKKFILSLILIIIFNCGGCAPESQTTKYPEGTMVVMKLDRQNVCQVVPSSSYLWYVIKCPIRSKSTGSATTVVNVETSASASLLSSSCRRRNETGFVEMYVKEYEIEPLKENN